MRKMMILFTIK